jgi:GNAT superfamily N-acetyltransferase
MSVTVRPLLAEEWSLYRDLRLGSLHDAPDAFRSTYDDESALPEARWRSRLQETAADPLREVLIAEVDGEPAGITVCALDEGQPLLRIFAMWVARRARRRGAGAALLEEALRWGAGWGAERARLAATIGNEPAEALYLEAGFTPTGEREPLREGSSAVIAWMDKPIPD